MKKLILSVSCLLPLASWAADDAGPVSVSVAPSPAYIERTGSGQDLSADLEIANHAKAAVRITDVRARLFAADGTLLAWSKLDSNGTRPSIETIGPATVDPGATITVFNPFDALDVVPPVARVEFECRYAGPGGRGSATAEVRPVEYRQHARLILPVAGATLFAYDGPGLYSHHRRLDLQAPLNRDVLKLRGNSQRYALDLVVLDREGRPFRGDPSDQKNWAGFGFPIVAPADGVVLDAVGDLPDDIPEDEARLVKEPALMAGNRVLIDHGNGEFSLLCHFRKGGVRVKPGQRVRQGETIGEMGHSGMGSGLVHVHYELRSSADLFGGEGLPARYERFRRAGLAGESSGRIEAGAIVVTDPAVR